MKSFAAHYTDLIREAVQCDARINARTGAVTRTLRGGRSFTIDVTRWLPVPTLRKVHPKAAAAEIAWYLLGTQNPSFIMSYAPKLWGKFIDPETQLVTNSYGYRWRRHFGRDQIVAAIVALKKDPSNRQVYISAWDPARDGLGSSALNVPCPVGFTFGIREHELHSTMLLRSSDLFVGLPYDVMGHAMLMEIMRASIDRNLSLGTLTVTMADAHIYEQHVEMAMRGLATEHESVQPFVSLIEGDLGSIMMDLDDWVDKYASNAKLAIWPTYNPQPEVVA